MRSRLDKNIASRLERGVSTFARSGCLVLTFTAMMTGCSKDKSSDPGPTLDIQAPSAIVDLVAEDPSYDRIRLNWSAPGDDGSVGTASRYEIRFSEVMIDNLNWPMGTIVEMQLSPQIAGTGESFVVTGLAPDTRYYFGIRAADTAQNWSGLSNIATAKTLACGVVGSYNAGFTSAKGIAVQGGLAYLVSGGSLLVIDVGNPERPILLGSVDTPGFDAEDVAVGDGIAVVACNTDGLAVIDISNPLMPTLTGVLETSSVMNRAWISGKTVLVAEYGHGLDLVDVGDAVHPSVVGTYSELLQISDVAISGNYAFVIQPVGEMHIIDINNPAAPEQIAHISSGLVNSGVAVSGHMVYVSSINDVHVFDISDPRSPRIVGDWTGDDVAAVTAIAAEAGTVALVTNGIVDNQVIWRLQLLDFNNPTLPTELARFDIGRNVMEIVLTARLAFVSGIISSFAEEGLQVIRLCVGE